MVDDHLWLVGMMGSGKTAAGRLVAGRLEAAFVDTDEMICAEVGSTVSEIFAARSEEWFRAEEAGVIERLARSRQPAVISTGGGAVLSESNRRIMAGSGRVVWLRAGIETLVSRLRETAPEGGPPAMRPLLAGSPDAWEVELARIERSRRRLYEIVSDIVVEVDGLAPEQVAERVVGELNG